MKTTAIRVLDPRSGWRLVDQIRGRCNDGQWLLPCGGHGGGSWSGSANTQKMYVVVAYTVMVCIGMAYVGMIYIGVAYITMACIVVACIVMARIVLANMKKMYTADFDQYAGDMLKYHIMENSSVKSGSLIDQFNGRGGNGGGRHTLDCGAGYRITGYKCVGHNNLGHNYLRHNYVYYDYLGHDYVLATRSRGMSM